MFGLSKEAVTIISNIMGPLGTLLACVMFGSSIGVIRQVIRDKSIGKFSYIPYLLQLCNCSLWVIYALGDWGDGSKLWCFVANGLGLIIVILTYAVYTYYCSRNEKRALLKTSVLPLIAIIAFAVYVVFADIAGKPTTPEVAALASGKACMILNLIMYMGPCAGLKEALSKKSTEYLPLSLGVTTVVNSIPWFSYGFVIEDINIWLPNACGVFFGLLQVLCFVYLTKCAGKEAHLTGGNSASQSFATAGDFGALVPTKSSMRNVSSMPSSMHLTALVSSTESLPQPEIPRVPSCP
eukprot:TRINITY_DN10990_c0_g1_i1.p1 TRINITY_DN10990_c0_g1~~TRINITY_DN10990_c0_g1_i1.p1  ORF type:complete len:295 (-),score=23.87 TRINITY_DN10990_c0_g1_i1:123-1007(-)